MTIETYQKVNKIAQASGDSIEKEIDIASAITGKSKEEIENLPLAKVKALTRINISGRKKKYVLINKRLYKGLTDPEELTTGQYVDLKTFGKDFIPNLHNMLAIIYKPVFKRYKHEEVAEDMKKANLDDVYGLLFFYSNILEKLSPTIQISLELAKEEIAERLKELQDS